MAWDRPAGWVPPDEQRKADEAAERFAQQRELADRQSSALADAIVEGFTILACAVLAASDHPPNFAFDRYAKFRHGDDDTEPVSTEPAPGLTFGEGAFPSPRFAARPAPTPDPAEDGIDELLGDDDNAASDPRGTP